MLVYQGYPHGKNALVWFGFGGTLLYAFTPLGDYVPGSDRAVEAHLIDSQARGCGDFILLHMRQTAGDCVDMGSASHHVPKD